MYKSNKTKRFVLKTMSFNISSKRTKTTTKGSLPTYVRPYDRSVTDSMSKELKISAKTSCIEEKKLRRFFKCTKFNLRTGIRSEQCFVCRNSKSRFEDHLKTNHSNQEFYCCYCYPKLSYGENQVLFALV